MNANDTTIATIKPKRVRKPRKPASQREPSGAVRRAIDAMVWQGHHRDKAAKDAGMLPKSLYNAFRKHHVRSFYLGQLEVLRTSARAKTFHRLEELRDQDANRNAAVAAAKALEQITDVPIATGASGARLPGVIVVIAGGPGSGDHRTVAPAPMPITIEHRPVEAEPPHIDTGEAFASRRLAPAGMAPAPRRDGDY